MSTDDLEAQLAAAALATGDSTGWFDQLYAAGERGRVAIPWSRTEAHPLLLDWARARDLHGRGQRAVVVGCGLGADAEYLSSLGFTTTAFDISPAAIRLARRRHPHSQVHYTTANLLDPPPPWWRAFELVVEIINVGRLVAAGGTLLAIEETAAVSGTTRQLPPWPLLRDEIQSFAADGLDTVAINALPLPAGPDEQRWVAHFRRPTTGQFDAGSRQPEHRHARPALPTAGRRPAGRGP
jgi:SAM-dependent methyltransferase